MASRIMHMAVTKIIAEKWEIKDRNRLLLGAVLPDVYREGDTSHESHLKMCIRGGGWVTYDLTSFKKRYGERMTEDSLYLGYYLHLVQDLVYRDFVYNEYHWNPTVAGNIERLHNDYRLINSYIIEKYGLRNELSISDDFEKEPINALYPFGIHRLCDDLKSDFTAFSDGDIFFFTKEMADSFIGKACEICDKELQAWKKGKSFVDAYDWAWKKRAVSLLETTLNTRELGGYRTRQGKMTKVHTLLRSDEQKQLSSGDIAYLSERQITTIIDMRTNRFTSHLPSPFANRPPFAYHNIPIEEGSGVPESIEAVPVSYMNIASDVNMRQVYQCIAHAPQGVLFHCSAGKDRSGVVSAILLLLAEVRDKDIIENYMMTKEYNAKRFALARKNHPDLDINIIIPREEFMIRFLQLFRHKYGDAKTYMSRIGVLSEEIEMIQSKLVDTERKC